MRAVIADFAAGPKFPRATADSQDSTSQAVGLNKRDFVVSIAHIRSIQHNAGRADVQALPRFIELVLQSAD